MTEPLPWLVSEVDELLEILLLHGAVEFGSRRQWWGDG